jgi:hypothetical protein
MWSAHAVLSRLFVALAGTHWVEAMEGSHPLVELNDGDTATLSEDVYSINFAPGTAATTVKLSGLQQSEYFALFMEHLPSEFSAALLGPEGSVEAPVLEGGEEQDTEEQSGDMPYQSLH